MYKKKNVSVNQLDDTYLLSLMDDDCRCVYVTEIAYFIFNLCDGNNDENAIIRFLTNKYDVTEEDCKNDVVNCLNDLLKAGFLEVV